MSWNPIKILNQILASQQRMEAKMADIATDITNLVAAVTSLTADVQTVLADLAKAPNITPDQQASLEAQIAAIQQLDATVKAALPPAPTPTPAA